MYNNTDEYSATLVSANTRAGVLRFGNNLTITPKTPALAGVTFEQGGGTFSRDFIWNAKFEVYNTNGVVYSTSATSTTSTVTIPINGVNINLTPNTAYNMRVYATLIQRVNVTGTSLSNNVWSARVYLNTNTSSNQTATATISSNVTFTTNYNVYNNKFYSNGLLFSQGTDKYFALCAKPTTNDDILAQWRNGNAIYRIKKNVGLLYNLNGGSSYYLANPVVLSFRVAYDSTTQKYGYSGAYNPKGLSFSFSGSGTALTITHSYGKALNVSVIIHASRSYATLQSETTTSFTLNLGGNYDATITCIDTSTY